MHAQSRRYVFAMFGVVERARCERDSAMLFAMQ
jgi:hypothetical protein